MRRSDRKDYNNDNAVNNPRPPQREPESIHDLKKSLMTVRANLAEAQKVAQENQEAGSQLVHVQQEIQTYQIKVNELKEHVIHNYQIYLDEKKNYQVKVDELEKRAAQNYLIYIDEKENYQQALNRYNEAKAKATELIAQRDEWQQRAKENQDAVSQLTQIQQDIQIYQVEVNELRKRAAHNYEKYVDEKDNYEQALNRYNEEKARADELLAKYQKISSERDNYLTLYNEVKAELKHERRSKASIKGWETRRKAENEKLKREIAEMVVLLRESLTSKDEAVNNLYLVAERMDRIQSLVDSVEEETTGNPMGLVQKFKRIWLAIKEILSE
jgi:L-rhamnose mutarotase